MKVDHMSLAMARLVVTRCLTDSELEALYAAGDKLSSHQTKHDLSHALAVLQTARQLVTILTNRGYRLTEWETDVIIPLAAFLHDVGRAIDVKNHAEAGANFALHYLRKLTVDGNSNQTLPEEVIKRICKIIACHRSEKVLTATVDDPAWAIVVIADKCVGDEERVRPIRARVLGFLTFFRLSWIPLRKGGVHDRVNFAIKEAKLVGEEDTDNLVLQLTVDERVCRPQLVFETYADRFRACAKAADFLGCRFLLKFNDRTFKFPDAPAKS
ncbi:MAG: HD domain-containing protein [Candidatus Obscuribacterales bacterium]|nr:HD domain-containing protein [Candidatus Obscuribacterales bacterium]